MNEQTPYSIKAVAALMGYSERLVTEMFENEPGVLKVKRGSMSSIKRDVKKKLPPRPEGREDFVSRSSPL